MPKRVLLTCAIASSWVAAARGQLEPSWTQLPLETCGVDAFLRERPGSDGRGVVIAVLDTGVDPSIPGLTRTPDGDAKVIDVQDFSGEGDIELHRVRADQDGAALIDYDEDGAAIQHRLPRLPAGRDAERRLFWLGWLDEAKFVNSEVPDLNDNGKTDDRFPICVTALEGDGDDQAVCFIDGDLDRGFEDEKGLGNYRLAYDTFTLSRAKPEAQIVALTFAVNIFLRESKIVVHFDDGAHGTHVAGIAAGYQINNQAGFNGVAPGAKIISLKIGQNAVGGISTTDGKKRAMEYAARYAREHGTPVVCNLSYGVESTIEGNSDIDEFIDGHLRENPHLVFCTSAGNEGPGLSSVGTPAASAGAVTVGALLAPGEARDVQGYGLDEPIVTVFSSRGGELPKPDFVTPGYATSTVPRWVRNGDYWSGTSMASPYAAGLCALLISDAMVRHPGRQVRACDVKMALCLSGRPLTETTALDVGWGVPDVAKASDVLDRMMQRTDGDLLLGYEVSTPCPHGYKGRAAAAYWRSTYFPTTEPQVFTVAPVFAPGVDAAARTGLTRKFQLRSLTPWCKVPQETFYLRSEQTARVFVEYDAEQLSEPGAYVGVVEALTDGEPALRLINTVVVPYRFSAGDDYTGAFVEQTATGWRPKRYFIAVPPGASAMRLELAAPPGEASKASIERIFDAHGHGLRRRANVLDTDAGKREVVWSITDELTAGVWEVDVLADRPDREWPFDLRVRFFGLEATPDCITEFESSSRPSGEVTVTNRFERLLVARADGMIEGFRMRKEDKFEGLDAELSYEVKLSEGCDAVRLDLELSAEAWAEATDIGVSVEDESGKNVFSSAFDNNTFKATVDSPTPGKATALTVKIRAGFAVSDDKRKTPITVNIDHLLDEPVSLDVARDGSNEISLVPSVPIDVEFEAADSLPKAPQGTQPVGYLQFRELGSDETALRVPIAIEGD